jgi:hypothetical protein
MATQTLLRQLKIEEDGEEIESEISLIPSKICFDTSVNRG